MAGAQYTFAADRTLGFLAELLDPWQPALATHTLTECRELAEPALLADDADDARRKVRSSTAGR